jgi:F0F1-type ATP synthase assembly protein I
MARTKADGGSTPKKQGRLSQLRAVFSMTRRSDPAAVWWMLLAFVGTVALAFAIGYLIDHPIYVTIIGVMLGVLFAVAILARRAEGAAYAQLAGQPGAAGAALQGLRRGWSVEQQPVAIDPRSQDMVFRAVGRPGVVLVTEGPVPRVNKLADKERTRLNRVLPNVPVPIVNAGDGPDQVPLRKVSRTMTRMKPALTKGEVSEVAKRLRALGAAKLPIPKGVDPMRARPDRKATRGR